jgi:hypothetical protein
MDRLTIGTKDDEQSVNECQRCGTHVSDGTRRLYGDNETRVWACRTCVRNDSDLPSWETVIQTNVTAIPGAVDDLSTDADSDVEGLGRGMGVSGRERC